MKKHRPDLTPEELQAAEQLKKVWEEKKKALGLTQEKVAHRFGWANQSAVSQYLNGRVRLGFNALIKFSNLLGVSPEEIFPRYREYFDLSQQDVEFMRQTGQVRPSNVSRIDWGNTEPAPGPDSEVPLISWVQAGAFQSVADPYQPGDAEEWLPSPLPNKPHLFALRVRGVSMEPRFREGEIIYVDPDAPADNGKFVVVRMDDSQEATFKQLVIEGGHKYLKALNPHWPEPIIEINGKATICGVVVFKGEKV